jgi:3-isopropylmalate dehydrogenase
MIGSVAMMLEYSFGMVKEANQIWAAMQGVFAEGYTTPDLARDGSDEKVIGTDAFGQRVVDKLGAM